MISECAAQPMNEQIITLSGVHAYGTHGVLKHEHQVPQEFVVDAVIRVCAQQAVEKDDITATISYADVADRIVAIIHGSHVDLIETLAEHIAQAIIELGARWVQITVHKPHAPIGQNVDDVSVELARPGFLLQKAPHRLVIALGSNLDDPRTHVDTAISQIAQEIQIQAVSDLYQTEPQLRAGQDPQPDFVNCVLVGESDRPLLELLHTFQKIEASHGRSRKEHWGARTLDIDIVDANGIVSADPELKLPHPRACERRFVLEPWHSIDPCAHVQGKSLSSLLARVRHQRVEKIGAWRAHTYGEEADVCVRKKDGEGDA